MINLVKFNVISISADNLDLANELHKSQELGFSLSFSFSFSIQLKIQSTRFRFIIVIVIDWIERIEGKLKLEKI